jgi:hypothetical protein
MEPSEKSDLAGTAQRDEIAHDKRNKKHVGPFRNIYPLFPGTARLVSSIVRGSSAFSAGTLVGQHLFCSLSVPGSRACPRNPFVFSNPRLTDYRLKRARWIGPMCKIELHYYVGFVMAFLLDPGLMRTSKFLGKAEAVGLQEVDNVTITPVVESSCHEATEYVRGIERRRRQNLPFAARSHKTASLFGSMFVFLAGRFRS